MMGLRGTIRPERVDLGSKSAHWVLSLIFHPTKNLCSPWTYASYTADTSKESQRLLGGLLRDTQNILLFTCDMSPDHVPWMQHIFHQHGCIGPNVGVGLGSLSLKLNPCCVPTSIYISLKCSLLEHDFLSD